MTFMDDVNKILDAKGVQMVTESSLEMVSVPMRDIYLLYAFATTGYDVLRGSLPLEAAIVILEALGANPQAMQAIQKVYFQECLDFQQRTKGKCDLDKEVADHLLAASKMIDRIERAKRKQI